MSCSEKILRISPHNGKPMDASPPTRPMFAAVTMVCAMAIIGVIDNFIIQLADEIGLWQFHFVRALIAIPLVMSLAFFGLGTLRPQRIWAVALRSALVGVAMLFYFSALALMSIAQALAGLFTSPIFVLLITAIVLRQHIGPWRILAVAFGFAGILLVLEVDPINFDLKTLIPVVGGFFYAMSAIVTRTLCARESTVALLAGMWIMLGTMGAIGLVVLWAFPMESVAGPQGFVTRGWVWPMQVAAPWVALQALGSVCGVFLIIKSYQLGETSFVAVFEYSVMIFGPLFAWLALGQSASWIQVAGIGLIFSAGAIIALRSR